MTTQLSLVGAASVDDLPPTGLACLVIVESKHGLHLTTSQLIHDNLLRDQEVTLPELLKCANSSGMTAKAVTLDWKGLSHLKRALPAIVRLRDGSHMVLLRLEGDANSTR